MTAFKEEFVILGSFAGVYDKVRLTARGSGVGDREEAGLDCLTGE